MRITGPATVDARSTAELAEALVGTGGEMSAQKLGRLILDRLNEMDDGERKTFFDRLATAMEFDPGAARVALAENEDGPSRNTYQRLAETTGTHQAT